MKYTFASIGIAGLVLAMATFSLQAQTTVLPTGAASTTAGTVLTQGAILAQAATALQGLPLGATINVNGQSFTLTTNAAGQISGVTTTGPAGNAAVSALTTPTAVANTVAGYVAQNNTNDFGFYGSNDLTAGVGVDYLQNSGQTIADIQIAKYGLLSSLSGLGLEAGVLQGNAGGKQSTAGGYGGMDYRQPIGSVAAHVGADVLWDQWSGQAGGVAHALVELRQNPHLGESAGVKFEAEPSSSKQNLSGLWLVAQINYSF
jgi:hypothetical protein